MKTLIKLSLCIALSVVSARATTFGGQNDTTNTTLSTALTTTTNPVCIASATGVNTPSVTTAGTILVVDSEAMTVLQAGPSSTCFVVRRGSIGTGVSSHLNSATVWVGNNATSTGDSSRPFSGGAIVPFTPSGPCTASAQFTLPLVVAGTQGASGNGRVVTCTSAGWWGMVGAYYLSPTACTFVPTTLTVTNTYATVGASNAFVLNGVTNAAAGTLTLNCNVLPPTSVTLSQGAILQDIYVFAGSQTVAPTSTGTATLGSITFPAAATTETASTVTPVAVGGTLVKVAPTAITTVTTAGAFLTISVTPAATSPVRLSTDLQILQFTLPFGQSAASAMTINTPGILVHYVNPVLPLL